MLLVLITGLSYAKYEMEDEEQFYNAPTSSSVTNVEETLPNLYGKLGSQL